MSRKNTYLIRIITFIFIFTGLQCYAGGRSIGYTPVYAAAGSGAAAVGENVKPYQTEEDTVWAKNFDMASDDLHSVVFGRDRFVAVGGDGTILASADGTKWTRCASGTTSTLQGVAWNGKKFAAAGTEGTILISEDGITWNVQSLGEHIIFSRILWDGSRFIAVGTDYLTGEYNIERYRLSNGIIAYSDDGSNWKASRFEDFDGIYGIAGGPGKYVIIADKHYEEGGVPPEGIRIFISKDLSGWTPTEGGKNSIVYAVSDIGGRFVATGADGALLTSEDGENWSDKRITPGYNLSGVIFNNTKYIAFGSAILDSPDGESWEKRAEKEEAGRGQYFGAAWGKDRFVAVGVSGIISLSKNGSDWTDVFSAKCNNYTGIYWDGQRFIAIGDKCSISVSTDGGVWTNSGYGSFLQLNSLAWNGKRYVAVGGQQFMRSSGGIIISSPDLVHWTEYTGMEDINNETAYGNEVNGVASDGNQFVAVQGSGRILSSGDGTDWSVALSVNNANLTDILWDGKNFIAVGYSGAVLVSKDGRHWVGHNAGKAYNFKKIIRDGNRYVATAWTQDEAGFKSSILVSADAVKWETRKTVPGLYLFGIAWDGSGYFITGEQGKLLYSQDLENWSAEQTDTGNTLMSAAWDGSRLVVAGFSGTILTRASKRDTVPPVLETDNETEQVEALKEEVTAEKAAATDNASQKSSKSSELLSLVIVFSILGFGVFALAKNRAGHVGK